MRRQKVASGEWTEGESNQQLQNFLVELDRDTMGTNKERIFLRDLEAMIKGMQLMDNPERLMEREYHFDENLGQSLDDHIAELKQKLPGATIYSRRDRDGFAIIKTSFLPEFKYDLNAIEKWDKDEALDQIRDVKNSFLGKFSGNTDVELTQDELAYQVKQMLNDDQSASANVCKLDAWSKLKLNELAKSTVDG